MRNLSRREFLRALATGAGAAALSPLIAACQPQTESPSVKPEQPAAQSIPAEPTTAQGAVTPCLDSAAQPCENPAVVSTESQIPTEQPLAAAEPAQPGVSNPDLVVAHSGEPEDLVRRALAALGGMERFVKKDAWVIIKPNICTDYHTYEYATTTNPWVVAALVKLAFEAGAKTVQVMDSGFGGSPKSGYKTSGIQEQVEAAGGEMVLMPNFKFKTTAIPEGVDIKEWDIYEDILAADLVIDVPIAKDHGSTRLTLGMKNLMGVILDRGRLHNNLGQRIADITSRVRPGLTVIDAVRILTANGPTGGNLDDVKKLDTIVVSPDIVAADSYATRFFDLKPDDIRYIKAGAEMGLGRMDLENLIISEV
jgi:uncharacterized protein (DUF362 family)